LFATASLLPACSYTADMTKMTFSAKTLYADQYCGRDAKEPRVSTISNTEDLKAVYQRLRQHFVGSKIKIPDIDFQHDTVVLIEMGMRPTGGYSLSLADEAIQRANHTLIVNVVWNQPIPGTMVTQALTSPCLLIQVNKTGFNKIQVRDQNNKVRVEMENM
jgi:hypothetical protein